jgi:hypothetical protein
VRVFTKIYIFQNDSTGAAESFDSENKSFEMKGQSIADENLAGEGWGGECGAEEC